MPTGQSETDWKTMLSTAGPYPLEAFAFVRDGLGHTVEHVHHVNEALDETAVAEPHAEAIDAAANPTAETPTAGDADGADLGGGSGQGGDAASGRSMVGRMRSDSRHVTGQQLCLGLRDYAIKRYGMMAPAVLRTWNLRRTEDFGRIVFAMIEHGLMSKTADDTLEDFRSVYDFDEAFARETLMRHVGRS